MHDVEVGKTKFTSAAELWPGKLHTRKDGIWVELRDVTVGPFENKKAAENHVLAIQDEILGWAEPEFYVGIVFKQGDSYWVDRWRKEDGPFESWELAQAHKAKLLKEKESSNG